MRAHLRGDDLEDAQAKRDQAYEEYAASISQTWKNRRSADPILA
jgi:hypothetical protein